MHPFCKTEILLPNVESMEKWAVIACDQFVSQPQYWANAEAFVGDAPSALRMILPEAYLAENCQDRISHINEAMTRYLQKQIFQVYPESFIYVERTLQNGSVRKGVVGAMDLAQYDFFPDSKTAIRATEETVLERLPPRMEIRRDALLELPHVLLLADDTECALIESLTAKQNQLPLLYDFELMAGGGRIRGFLVGGKDADDFTAQLEAYGKRITDRYGPHAVVYAVGDGNHSIAAAKACYAATPTELSRYALVELENIHDETQVFEPIHRIIKDTDVKALLQAMTEKIGCTGGTPIRWFAGGAEGTIHIAVHDGKLAVGIVQDFLDQYLADNPGIIDYIHGDDALQQLSREANTLGLLLPAMDKSAFFPSIIRSGTLPRKTFSMGHATEKRYYLEARKIK